MKSQEWTKLFIEGTGDKVLDSMNIYCPNNTIAGFNNDCNIMVHEDATWHSYLLDGIIFYTVEGLDDINVQCEYGSGGFWKDCFDGARTETYREYPWIRMNCGDGYQYFCNVSTIDNGTYNELCYLENSCNCPDLVSNVTSKPKICPTEAPTASPSTSPTSIPAMPPSESPTTQEPTLLPSESPSTMTPTDQPSLSPIIDAGEHVESARNTTRPVALSDLNEQVPNDNMIKWIIITISVLLVIVVIIAVIFKLKKTKRARFQDENDASNKTMDTKIAKRENKGSHQQVSSGIMLHEIDVPASPTQEVLSANDHDIIIQTATSGEGDEFVQDVLSNAIDNGMDPENDEIIMGDDEIVVIGDDEIATMGNDEIMTEGGENPNDHELVSEPEAPTKR